MASNGYTLARGLLVVAGVALAGACATQAPATRAPLGELALEWLPPADTADAALVELEVRGVSEASGEGPIRRHVVLGSAHGQQAHLSLPPGLYTVQLSSAALQADRTSTEVNGGEAQELRLELPPPSMVLVSAAGSTRARVELAETEVWARSSW